MTHVLVIDQGTNSTRAILFDDSLSGPEESRAAKFGAWKRAVEATMRY